MNDNLIKLINDIFGVTNECEECNNECSCNNSCCKKCDETDDINEKLDLTKDEDYNKFNDYIDECKHMLNDDSNNSYLNMLFKLLFGGVDINEYVDNIKKMGDEIHESAKQTKKTPELPSSKLNVQQKEQIHKIVGEYVDTIIKPNTNMETKVINDVYAGLFEFACWLLNK